jgi:carboxypeptidase T
MTTHTRAHRRLPIVATAISSLLVLGVLPASAAASQFPAGYEGFHTFAEVAADVAATATAHPDIVSRFSIGKSYQGRDLWAVKISDNVALDENEPEVLYDGGTHADEHMSVEMTLRILHWYADGYGSDTRITNIVNSREIWIVFQVNPDGAEYDIAGGRFHHWRKNRQPNSGTTAIGTDLNRNFGYRWGLEGNTSANPRAITYRGPRAFSAPETRAMRDFLASRVVGGRQQIKTAITFHEFGRLVMWPYGYTYTDIPGDMTKQDHAALATMGKRMAAYNGYHPEQASDLYLTSGTTRDYEYGTYRIFSFTFELSNRDYPNDNWIAGETGRNREAVLYLAERAGCPLAVLGTAVRAARCGAFDDDLEVRRGWTVNPDGTDTATSGRFARANPVSTFSHGPKQLGAVTSGSKAFVTGARAGSSPNAYDLDGRTTVRSIPIDLPATLGQKLSFRFVFAHGSNSSGADRFAAIVEGAGGTRTTVFLRTGTPTDRDGVWRSASVSLDPWAGTTIRIRFQAVDTGHASLVEVEVDDVRVTRPS